MKKRKIKFKNIILIILAFIFIFAISKMLLSYIDLSKNERLNKRLIDEVITVIEPTKETDNVKDEEVFIVDFDKLLSMNSDTIGWIRFNYDKVNNPIVQTSDNYYYLDHSFMKKNNQAGTVFMDYRNNSLYDKNVVLFAHSMLDGSMFGSIKDTLKDGFFDNEENNYIQIINTNNEVLNYKIFSYYTIEAEEYYITTSFESDELFSTFIDIISKRSYKKFDVDVSINDSILTLSTCSGTGSTSKRLVVHAKRLL